jgi:hypothetical protein
VTTAAAELNDYVSASLIVDSEFAEYDSASTIAGTQLSQYEAASGVAASESSEYTSASAGVSTAGSVYESYTGLIDFNDAESATSGADVSTYLASDAPYTIDFFDVNKDDLNVAGLTGFTLEDVGSPANLDAALSALASGDPGIQAVFELSTQAYVYADVGELGVVNGRDLLIAIDEDFDSSELSALVGILNV